MLRAGDIGEQAGHYDLLGELSTGGMAIVYVGLQRVRSGPASLVAIKSIRPEIAEDEGFTAMFLDEATLTARIKHPNVVSTLDVASADGRLLIVMEYVEGVSLAKLLELARERRSALPAAVTIAIVRDVLRGLHAAHGLADDRGNPLGVVHRDVSPQNILVGVDGVARILDFGIAKASSQRHVTALGEVKGRLAYMPPEQQLAEGVDRRTDVYAAGVVVWEMLVGRQLFAARDEEELVRQVFEGPIEPPSLLADEPLPSKLDRVVLRALSRGREARWRTAEEMANALVSTLAPASPAQVAAVVRGLGREEIEQRARHIYALQEQRAAETSVLTREERIILDVLSTSRRKKPAVLQALAGRATDVRGGSDPPRSSESSRESRAGARARRRARRQARTVLVFAMLGGAIVLGMAGALWLGMRGGPGAKTPVPTLAPPIGSVSMTPPNETVDGSAIPSRRLNHRYSPLNKGRNEGEAPLPDRTPRTGVSPNRSTRAVLYGIY